MALPDYPHLDDPHAQLERSLIDDYVRTRGFDPDELRARRDAEARKVLCDASTYAATRLTEVESRAHYIHEIHHASGD
jgi:hypothetical protein